jgi:hypothetical protein
VRLALDHLIIRAADPAATLAELAERGGFPVLAPVEEVAGLASGIVRAGGIDIEVLGIGREPPPRPYGYGAGFVSDSGLEETVAALRALAFPTSPVTRAQAGAGDGRRTWRAVQVHGLLPDPFPVPATTRRPGALDRVAEAATGALGKVPAVARAATRHAGRSMIVVTEYGFDAGAWRAHAGTGPEVAGVHLGTAGHRAAWGRFPLADDQRLHLHDGGAVGVTRIVLADGPAEGFAIGDVAFEVAGR